MLLQPQKNFPSAADLASFLQPYNLQPVAIYCDLTVNGVNNAYTVPAGKKLILISTQRFNGTGGAITLSQAVVRSGTAYRIFAANATSIASPAAGSTFASATAVVCVAGDVIRFTTNGTGMRVILVGYLVDSNAPINTYWVENASTTPQTLFTVPAGKKYASVNINTSNALELSVAISSSNLHSINNGGGSPVITPSFVESGGSLVASKALGTMSPTDNGAVVSGNAPSLYNAGDYISIVSSINTTGTHVRMTVIEFDA